MSLEADFQRDGFVIVREFLSSSELDELRDNLERYIRDVLPQRPKSAAFYHDADRPETLKQMQHMDDPFFVDYAARTRWVALATALNGEPSAAQLPEWFNKPPGVDHPTPPHQDNFYFCLEPPHVATLWLALDEVGRDNGCLHYVAGSHREGIRPHGPTEVLGFSQGITDYSDQDRGREQAILLAPGDLVAHHGELIHRADPNRSERSRRAFAMVFRGASCRRNEAAYARYEAAFEEQQRRLQGAGK